MHKITIKLSNKTIYTFKKTNRPSIKCRKRAVAVISEKSSKLQSLLDHQMQNFSRSEKLQLCNLTEKESTNNLQITLLLHATKL